MEVRMDFVKRYAPITLVTTVLSFPLFADTTTTVQTTTIQTTDKTPNQTPNQNSNTNQTLTPNSNPNNPNSWTTNQNSTPAQNSTSNQNPAPTTTTSVSPDQETKVNDTDVYNDIIDALSANKQTAASGVSVSVQDGVVYLSGTASTPEQADVAQSIAGSVYGVKKVESTITVTHVTK